MSNFLGFVVEHSIVNAAPIFGAIGLFALVFGSFLVNVGVDKWLRVGIYTAVGGIAGVVTYAYFDIPKRSIEVAEALYLFIGMVTLGAILVIPAVMLKERFRQRKLNVEKR